MVDRVPTTCLQSQLLRKRYPIVELLLHEGLWVDAEALQMHQEDLGVLAHHDLLRGHLARQACLTQKLVVLVEKLLNAEALHAVDQTCVTLQVETQVEECFCAFGRRLAGDAGDLVL